MSKGMLKLSRWERFKAFMDSPGKATFNLNPQIRENLESIDENKYFLSRLRKGLKERRPVDFDSVENDVVLGSKIRENIIWEEEKKDIKEAIVSLRNEISDQKRKHKRFLQVLRERKKLKKVM